VVDLQTVTAEPTLDSPTLGVSGVVHVTVSDAGSIVELHGKWGGQVLPEVASLLDLIHPECHDQVRELVDWLADGATCHHGVELCVRGVDGWDRGLVFAERDGEQFRFTIVPPLPDPVHGALDLVLADRSLDAVLDEALASFSELDIPVWATVHFGADDEERFRSIVATTGLDTFRRSVEAAAGGDAVCVWDGELDDEAPTFRVGEVADGVALAGRHAGIGACRVIGVEGASGDTVASLTVWAETPELLDHPSIETLCTRVTPVIMLAFDLQASREALVWAENHDTLTRLWNRQGFFSQLRTPKAQRNCAVACIDIDDFRAVNESHGNAVGDGLLGEVANRLREIMRPGDVVARVSADEFAVLLTDVKTPEAVAAIGERIMGLFEAPFHLGGQSTEVGVTMGMAACLPERSGAKMFDAAERAMLETKSETRGTWNVV
jgi:diguanylate cyclase (GGDEF)-like protein